MREYLEMMIKETEKAMTNASQFGDELTMEALRNQKARYEAELAKAE